MSDSDDLRWAAGIAESYFAAEYMRVINSRASMTAADFARRTELIERGLDRARSIRARLDSARWAGEQS